MAKKDSTTVGTSAPKQGQVVAKSLTPEEQSIIANIQSLLNQIGQEQAPAPEGPPEEAAGVEMAAGPAVDVDVPGEPACDEDEVQKSEGANETAEKRMSELPDDDKEALTVLKALMRMGDVKKSARPVDPTLAALARVAKSLSDLSVQVNEQGTCLSGLLEGMGMVSVVQKSEPRPARRVSQSDGADASAVLKALMAQVAAGGQAAAEEPAGTLQDALTLLTGK